MSVNRRRPAREISLAYATSVISNQAGIICEVANPEYLICRGLCPLRDRATSLSPKKGRSHCRSTGTAAGCRDRGQDHGRNLAISRENTGPL